MQDLLTYQDLARDYDITRSQADYAIKKKCFPPAVKVGTLKRFIRSEIEAVHRAQICGATPAQVAKLVDKLVAQRQAFQG